MIHRSRSHHLPATPVFACRAEHVAALDAAERVGPQPGILVDDLLPSLPYLPGELFALCAVACPPANRFSTNWAEVPTERIDPRAPWRADNSRPGLAHHVKGSEFLVVRGIGPMKGWEVVLLSWDPPEPVREYLLIHDKSGKRVRFGTRYDAEAALGPLLRCGCGLPRKLSWSVQLRAGRHEPRS